jgi:hypothetical protein
MNIFYMNLGWSTPDHPEMQRTLFHEFQHMINYSRRTFILNQPDGLPEMDTWMNEGLAESAEHHGTGTPGASRIRSMNKDENGRLSNGCSLAAWPDDADDINYGLAYTFLQYLRLQRSNPSDWTFMGELIENENGDYRALKDVMRSVNDLNSFDKMVKGYHLARFINDTSYKSGLYSFKTEKSTFTFTCRAPSAPPVASTKLGPGGAIYIPVSSEDVTAYSKGSGAGADIQFYPYNHSNPKP